VIRDRERGESERGRLLDELFGMAGTVEEREVGVAVQLRVPVSFHWSS